MKPLFRKDLRENFRLALAAAAVFALIIVLDFHSAGNLLHNITHSNASGEVDSLHPLLSSQFITGASFFCAIFGVALGFFQARSEAHRDLWAFLVHRPITRTQIFQGKAAAGLCLYSFGAGLPLLVMICYVAVPGTVAAPTEAAMVLPAFAIFLSGIAYYFAGMLTGLRQARWFGSRTFGIGAAIAGSVAVNELETFWLASLAAVLLVACVGLAAWGAYQSGGFYRGQPAAGKIALTLSVAFGCVMLLGLAALLIVTLTEDRESSRWQTYVMTRDGQMCIQSTQDGTETISDLGGKPLINPDTHNPYTSKEFNSRRAFSQGANSWTGRKTFGEGSYNSASTFFSLWNVSKKTLWYLDRYGKLVGFSGLDSRHVGDIVADNGPFLERDAFSGNNYFNTWNTPDILCTTSTAYRVDLDDRKLEPVFTTAPADPIVGFEENDHTGKFVLLTQASVRLIDTKGQPLLTVPYVGTPGEKIRQVSVCTLTPGATNRYAVWFHPDFTLNAKLDWKLPIHVEWIGEDSKITQTREFAVFRPQIGDSFFENLTAALILPLPSLLFPDAPGNSGVGLRLACCALFGLVGWTMARRYRFTAGAAVAWTLFFLILGVTGLLTFFFVQEFTRREPCPNCGKPRAVDREQCEHCAADFPPPAKIGIEIFEPLATPRATP